MNVNKKIAVVTGAGTGIGKSTALALLAQGYTVVLAGRRKDTLEKTIAEAGDVGNKALAVATDVSSEKSVLNLFAIIKEVYGRVDLLFNNAGRGAMPVEFDEIPLEDWQSTVNVNLTGSFLCAQGAFRLMKNQRPRGGRIINNGSISAHSPRPCSSPYTSTKHAITGLTKSLALDGRPYDIVAGQIDIGNAITELTASMNGGVPQANGTLMVEPGIDSNEVAKSVVYMDSLPLNANVLFITVMASKMPFVGRG
jgi:NAD(P)-dependent dehydrogenase (short-subunit alcohol dehydrogenase family)